METSGRGQPIRNLQRFLRDISQDDKRIPTIIPDGIFGPQTQQAVIAFQTAFHLPPTGIADQITWNRILTIFDIFQNSSRNLQVFPTPWSVINPGDSFIGLYTIQGVLAELSHRFPQIGTLRITGVHDEDSVNVVKRLQVLFGLEPTGILDHVVWSEIVGLYETFISSIHAPTA